MHESEEQQKRSGFADKTLEPVTIVEGRDGTSKDNTDGRQTAAATAERAEAQLAPGVLIAGKYQILSSIGQGGMSEVYLVRHVLLNKEMALKIMRQHLAGSAEALARFQREAEATSRLDHPNIVRVHDFGISENGSPFIAMDYIQGSTLSQLLEQDHHLSPERIVHIFSQACKALSHAHSRNVVHRDMKPSNIIVVNHDGDPDFVKIVDFGIAQLVVEDGSLHKLTQTGQIFGTPLYMSPEQCRGEKLDERTDVYSLACVMYEALTGKTPFAGTSVFELIFKHLNEIPAKIKPADLQDPKMREGLETILFRAMSKDPSDRYASMELLKADLDNIESSRAGGLARHIFKRWYLRRLLGNLRPLLQHNPLASLALSFLLLGGVIALFLTQIAPSINVSQDSQWHELDRQGQQQIDLGQRDRARQSFTQALTLARKLASRELTLASLNELLDLDRLPGESAKERLPGLQAEIAGLQGADPNIRNLQEALDQKLAGLHGLESNPDRQQELRDLCNTAIDTAMALSEAGNHTTSKDLVGTCKKIVVQALGPEDPLMFRIIHNLANIAHAEGNYAEAIAGYEATLALRKKLSAPEDAALARTLLWLARAYCQTGTHLAEAKTHLDHATALSRAFYSVDSPQVGKCKYHLAALYTLQGKKDKARLELVSAIAIFERRHEPASELELARCYSMMAHLTGDVSLCQKSLSILESMPEKDYQSLSEILLDLGELKSKNSPQQAEPLLLRAEAIGRRFNKTDEDNLIKRVWKDLATVYERTGKPGESVKTLENLLDSLSAEPERNRREIMEARYRLAEELQKKGDNKRAEKLLQQMFSELETDSQARAAMGQAIFYQYRRLLDSQNRHADAEQLAAHWQHINQTGLKKD